MATNYYEPRTVSTETTQMESSEHIRTTNISSSNHLLPTSKVHMVFHSLLLYHEDESLQIPTKCPYAPAKLTASHPQRT